MTDDQNAPTLAATVTPTPTAPSSATTTPPRSPDDRYVLRTLLGRGGMGEVWLARDIRIDRDIAIKLMRSDGPRDPDAVARFLREARVQGRLEHPAIVPVHDLGGEGDAPYFAMKRLTGTTLADVLAAQARGEGEGPWSRRKLLARLVDVCLAIELAHQRGVLHRDLKPANIMLGDFGETYVLDWGLARIADVAELDPRWSEPANAGERDMIRTSDLRSGESGSGQTMVGTMLGTPGYMAPEQMRGEAIDHRVDVFALGCILFEILVGAPAVPRAAAIEVTLSAPGHRPTERKRDLDVAPELDDLCARTTASDPAKRPQSARLLADEIQRFLDGDRDLARRRELAGEHASRAIAAVEHDDSDAARAEAMREAGSAIALDSSHAEAKALLLRLLLKPPAKIPPEASLRIADDRIMAGLEVIRASAWGYVAFLALLPLLVFLGVRDYRPLIALAALLVVLATLCFLRSRTPRPIGQLLLNTVIILHSVLLALAGIIFGPLFVLPVVVMGSMTAFLTAPMIDAPKRLGIGFALAVAVPLALEWFGVLPRTFYSEGGTLVLKPWAIDLTPTAMTVGLLATFFLQMIVTTVMLARQRRVQERAQEQLHVQSWHLRQLIPDDKRD